MINKNLMKALRSKTGLSVPRVYSLIQEKQKQMNYIVTTEQAAALVAGEYGVNISRILPPEELAQIRNIQGIKVTPVIQRNSKERKSERNFSINVELPHGIKISDPLLPQTIVKEASKMVNIYLKIYLFENSIRNLILKVLSTKYGKDWWETQVANDVKKDVQDRINKEKENRWHGKRGAHKMFYTDIGDLKSIISKNWNDFKDVIKKEQGWVKLKIEEIEFSRNVIAHNNPLSDDDIQRLEVNFKDWFKQIGSYQQS